MIDPRKVYGPNEAPPELVALIVPELARLIEEEKQTADSEVQPAGIPICIRPPFQGEAGHHSDHYPATPRGLKAFQVSN